MQLSKTNVYIAIAFPAALVGVVIFFFAPAFNTDVDIYFLYTLSGGYGGEPSGLLHYSDGAHPILNALVATLFRLSDGFNWYSFGLVLLHYVSCVVLLASLLSKSNRRYALIAFSLFFLFIESRLLLHFNFSGAALIAVISGAISLVLYLRQPNRNAFENKICLAIYLLLLFIGGLIRIHYLALFGIFSLWMALFVLSGRNFRKLSIIYFFLGVIVALSFIGQRYYYRLKIPGWQSEEKLRKASIYFSNHSRRDTLNTGTPRDRLINDLISISFLYDSKLTDYQAVKNFGNQQTKNFKSQFEKFPSFYWLFMEVRVYLFLFAAMILYLILTKNYKQLLRFVGMSVFPAITLITLTLFFRVTEVILLATLASITMSGFLCLATVAGKRGYAGVSLAIALLASAWMIFRIVKLSNENLGRISAAHGVIQEFNTHKDILFLDTGSFFNFHLSIWDLPKNYPIHNFIYNELFFARSYQSQLRKYGVYDLMKEIPVKKNIYLTGPKSHILIDYYRLVFHKEVTLKKIPGFNYINAYQITSNNP